APGSVCTLFYPFAGPAGYGWFVPKAGAVNVGFGGVASQFGGNIKAHWPAFCALLLERGLLSSPPPAPRSHPYFVGARGGEVRRLNAFIVGDAAGLATADLGEGIGSAVESGLAAARAIAGSGVYARGDVPRRSLAGLPGRLMERFVGA
ncbi:MAG: NAD(P)/FAD-dependent oxidoreductase, partial [Elusimicrobia bacterium]|nr:NAD(P)/FAD-dependent oxidoreductase [Elusimicrobiota bacterium]